MLASNAQAREDAAAFLKRVAGIDIAKCPHWQHGRWLSIQVLPPLRNNASRCLRRQPNPAMPGATVNPRSGPTLAILSRSNEHGCGRARA